MVSTPHELRAAAGRLGLVLDSVLRRTDKTLLVRGTFGGVPVAVKYLLDDDPFWADKWRHEAAVYGSFEESPPPIRIPRLLHTDGARLLVLEWIDGRPLDEDRYPVRELTPGEADAALSCVTALNVWRGAESRFDTVFDYRDRISRYHERGYLTDDDRDALHQLLGRARAADQINHGDPVPANILIGADGVASLLDWEFTGLFLPGFDLAMLHTQLGAHTAALRDRVDELVASSGIEDEFVINLAAVLTRELRIHHELSEGLLRSTRLPLIEAAWDRARERLHDRAARRT